MSVVKSSFYLAISTVLKIILGALSLKIIAYYIGSNGFGVLGQFMSIISIISLTAGLGITNGVISNISKNKDSKTEMSHVISAGFWIGFVFSCLLFFLFVFSNFISFQLFKTSEYSIVIKALAFLQFFNLFSVIFGGYLNGRQYSKDFSFITIISSIIGTLILTLLVYYFKEIGSMLGLIILSVFPGLILLFLYFVKFKKEITILYFSDLKYDTVKSLLRHSVMLVFSSCLLPLSQVFVRDLILINNSWSNVGYWQAALKLSESGVIFLNVIMVNYYFPEIGKCNHTELKKLINKAYLILGSLLLVYILSMFFFREILISIFFDVSFKPAQDLLVWQAIGDAFKVLCSVFGFLVVFKESVKIYLILETILFLTIVSLSYFFVPIYGTLGANYAYALSYFIYFIIGLFYLKNYIKKFNVL
ncbi:O-antigen translocase [Flavobacterium gyeonganense]|uniref:O-antigen translocase n=1 Tax=Flavobacterium gyeonganense TaxID=1310418 RepID=UPI002413F94F|nr:O-antigen translocase [Flavobacterium gyeonganense]